jgi:hypothetical protein
VFRGGSCVESYVGNVGTSERNDTFVHVLGAGVVAVEADVAEVGLNEPGLHVRYANCRFGYVDTQAIGYGLHGCLRGAIDIATGICCVACNTANVDYVALVALYHSRHDEACHGEQPLYVGVYHRVPIFGVALVFLFETERESGVVDQNINCLPFSFERTDCLFCRLGIAHVEHQGAHLRAFSLELCLYLC